MTASTFSASEKKENYDLLDKFPNSGRIFKIETHQSTEKKATKIVKGIIDSAITLATKESSETKSDEGKTENCPLHFYVLGCGEGELKNKRQVAELMNEITLKNNKKPDFIILLGDNFEETGVDSTHSKSFVEGFDKIYHENLEAIAGIPFFVVPGNHDHGFPVLYPLRVTGINNNLEKIASEVLHTYVDEKGMPEPKKINLFSQETLNLETMKKRGQTWNMPGRYYELQFDNKELFFIDTNTYVKEYIEYYLNGNKELNKQPAWLEHVAKNPETIKYLFMHHPLRTVGKRAFCSDIEEYLSHADIQLLIKNKIIDREDESYNEVIKRLLQKQGLNFDAVFAAHDHNMYHYNNQNEIKSLSESAKKTKLLRQIVAGGAGGGHHELQNRFLFEKNTHSFIKHRGFVSVQISGKPSEETLIDYYATPDAELYYGYRIKGHHLQYNLTETTPRKQKPDELGVKQLGELVMSTCNRYLTEFPPSVTAIPAPHVKKNWGFWPSYTYKVYDAVSLDAFFADDLKNHFKRFESNSFEESLNYVKYALLKCTESHKRDFFDKPELGDVFKAELMRRYALTFDQFLNSSSETLKRLFTTGRLSHVETKDYDVSLHKKADESWPKMGVVSAPHPGIFSTSKKSASIKPKPHLSHSADSHKKVKSKPLGRSNSLPKLTAIPLENLEPSHSPTQPMPIPTKAPQKKSGNLFSPTMKDQLGTSFSPQHITKTIVEFSSGSPETSFTATSSIYKDAISQEMSKIGSQEPDKTSRLQI